MPRLQRNWGRQAGRLPEGYEYRLPSEAEWEYAARGGQKSEGYKYSGSDDIDKVAWYWRNSGDKRLKGGDWELKKIKQNNCRTHPVGRKKPNELGIYDMSGNVWERCLDWYDSDYYGDSPRVDPVNTSKASIRVIRGGSWISPAALLCRSANRRANDPDSPYRDVGFRVVLAPAISADEEE